MTYCTWSEREDWLLREMWLSGVGIRKIEPFINGRSVGAVSGRLRKLDLFGAQGAGVMQGCDIFSIRSAVIEIAGDVFPDEHSVRKLVAQTIIAFVALGRKAENSAIAQAAGVSLEFAELVDQVLEESGEWHRDGSAPLRWWRFGLRAVAGSAILVIERMPIRRDTSHAA